MQDKRAAEKRKYMRFDIRNVLNLRVKSKLKDIFSKDTASVISKNMSIEGICFTSENKLKPGTKVELEMVLTSNYKPLRVKGEVVWSKAIKTETKDNFEVGVKLFTIEKNDENKFIAYVCDKMVEYFSQYLGL